jgi:tyrosyl-tRNA synthetase
VANVIERDDFAKRLAAGTPVSMLELLYPLLQGYDSVAIKADVELGGADQKFNLLLGRDVQRAYGMEGQVILTMPLLTGTDGERKMSKSFDNYVGVSESPQEMYGKTLSIPDSSLEAWYSLLIGAAPDAELSARDSKHALARALVERFHGVEQAQRAQAAFDALHVRREIPEQVPDLSFTLNGTSSVHLPALLAQAFGVTSSEARRALGQGGVRLDGEALAPDLLDLAPDAVDGRVLQLGKRRFARIRIA